MTFWHVETDYFALVVFLVMLFKNWKLEKESRFQKNAFYYVLLLSIVNVLVDIISSTAMNDVTNWWLYQLTMTAYVLTMPMLAAVWVCYTVVLIHRDKPKAAVKRDIALIMLPFACYAVLGLSNPFTGLFFHLTEDMVYSRGILFMPVGVGFIMLYSAIGIIVVLVNQNRIQPRSNVLLLSLFFATTALSIWIQLANPGWLVINACYAVVYVWCDMTVEEQNRQALYAEIRKQNTKLEAAAVKAETATQYKSMFLANMSHDMRTPMNAIIGLSNLAMDLQTVAELKEYMIKINASGKQLLNLINDTLDVSRIENGKLTLNPEYIMSAQLLLEGVASTQVVAEQKGVQFRVEKEGFQDVLLYVDAVKITKIFTNLLSNAVKFTPKGGEVVFSVKRLGRRGDTAQYLIAVRDTGIGMSAEFLQRVFEPFSQERTDYATNSTGTGLGMTIVKELSDFLGYRLEITSQIGKGTQVQVWADFQLAEHQPEPTVQPEKPTQPRSRRILVAEDHPLNAEIVKKLLGKEGYLVDVAQNGRECISHFAQAPINYYGLILMDIRMPEMDGLEATRILRRYDRADARTIPIIAMTANAFEQDVQDCMDAGMNGHLSKPVEPAMLMNTLAREMK